MSNESGLEVVALSKLYPQMQQPFSISNDKTASVSILRQRRPSPIPAPLIQYGPISCSDVPDFAMSEIAVAYLPDAVVTSTGAVIFEDKYIIQETLEGSVEANGIKGDTIQNCLASDEIVINCNKLGMWNYSLFLFEVAPSVMVASLIPGLETLRARVFFQTFMPMSDVENRLKVFDLFGVSSDRIVSSNDLACRYRGVVVFKLNDLHRSQRLSQLVSPVCATLVEAFSTSMDNTPRQIYVSRQRAQSRKIANFEKLREEVLVPRGIVPLELENLTIEAQVDIFSKADLVVAEHGAGLANIAFMRPGSSVLEIMPSAIHSRGVYRYLAAQRKLNYAYTTVSTPQAWRWDRDDISAPTDLYNFMLDRVQRGS